MIYRCCNENRKNTVLNSLADINGIDYLEVLDSEAEALNSPRQQTLLVHCLRPVPSGLTYRNILITGGECIIDIGVHWVTTASVPAFGTAREQDYFKSLPDAANVLVVRTSVPGDFAPYTLRLVTDTTKADQDPIRVTSVLSGFDPQLSEIPFSFKVECGPDFDCGPQPQICSSDLPTQPPINYLSKDYGSFRGIMIDRLSQLLSDWDTSSEADMGVVLGELIAYASDYLSYKQDAVATEAYLETARSRVTLRRHALLVDYHVQDGCNARAWIQLNVSGNPEDQIFLDHTRTRFYTAGPGIPESLPADCRNEEKRAALRAGMRVFEPMWDRILYPKHNTMSFYTWGDTDCCLPKGATEATLLGTFPKLQPGDVLIFREMIGPQTGYAADADLRHRCAVRLINVRITDDNGNLLVDPLFEDEAKNPLAITEIQWSDEDRLPFPLCISSTCLDPKGDKQQLKDVSKAFGNVVLADHGLSFTDVDLGTVPEPSIQLPTNPAANRCQNSSPEWMPVRFRPTIPDAPLSQVASVAQDSLSASALMTPDQSKAVPAIKLTGSSQSKIDTWAPKQDLLESGESDSNFVVEVESNGTATLRFGDDSNGKKPESGTHFSGDYRIGNGVAGNVGAETLVGLTGDPRIKQCSNPLPATRGIDPENNDQIRRRAPQAFLTQERAVTMDDYARVTEQNPQVDQAKATLRWTGSWFTVFIAVDPRGGTKLTPRLQQELRAYTERYSLAGQDIQLDSPQYVPLDIELEVCISPDYFQSDVQQALLDVLGSGISSTGQKGFFHPDNLTFGTTVYLSKIYAAARSVDGVLSVKATKFQRQGVYATQYIDSGEIKLGALQVARLANDRSYPDRGQLTLLLEGGK